MLTLYDFHESTFTAARPLFVACGVFDGVHRGHQALLAKARILADAAGGRAVALSFNPHPLAVLCPEHAPAMIATVPMRLRLLSAAGLGGCVMLNFNRAMSEMAPEDFFTFILEKLPHIQGFVVGEDWRFGCRQSGDAALLSDLAARRKREAVIVPPVIHDGRKISSTRIRAALRAGDLDLAQTLLGRPFGICGIVQHGRQIGRTLGVPTANLLPGGKNPVPPGSYAARVILNDTPHPASVYCGSRPTYQDSPGEYYVEAHLLDGSYNLYGQEITVELLRFLRPETKFPDEAALRAGIRNDLEMAKTFFRKTVP